MPRGGAAWLVVQTVICATAACVGTAGLSDGDDVRPDASAAGEDGGADTSTDAADAASPADADAAMPNDDAAVPAKSCAALLARDATLLGKNGLYAIDPDGPGGKKAITAFCEMTIDNGGWTLVGASSSAIGDGGEPFGWRYATGDIAAPSAPYSLDVYRANVTFTQILVGDRLGDSYSPATHAYRLTVPPDFIDHGGDAVMAQDLTTVLGSCMPAGGPGMLHYAGRTLSNTYFAFRDLSDLSLGFGLTPKGFMLNYTDCMNDGQLNLADGLVFVR
jgi:hypothetical protein